MQPVRVILFLAESQRPFKEPGRQLLRVFGIEISLVGHRGRWPPGTSRAPRGRRTAGLLMFRQCAVRPCGWQLGGAGGCNARKRVVSHKFVTRGGERSTGRSCDPDTHDVTDRKSVV